MKVHLQVHLDMARYHELGRFLVDAGGGGPVVAHNTDSSDLHNMDLDAVVCAPIAYDKPSAWFHLELAARCHVLEAVLTLAKIHLSLPHDLLKDIADADEADEDTIERGLELMQEAAAMGDRSAIIYMAEAYETGQRLCDGRCVCGCIRAHIIAQNSFACTCRRILRARVRTGTHSTRSQCRRHGCCQRRQLRLHCKHTSATYYSCASGRYV